MFLAGTLCGISGEMGPDYVNLEEVSTGLYISMASGYNRQVPSHFSKFSNSKVSFTAFVRQR